MNADEVEELGFLRGCYTEKELMDITDKFLQEDKRIRRITVVPGLVYETLSEIEATRLVSGKYDFNVIEEPSLIKDKGGKSHIAVARVPSTIAIWAGVEPWVKLIVICHEAGHLIDYGEDEGKFRRSSRAKRELRAWLKGFPLAIEMGIFYAYIDCWRAVPSVGSSSSVVAVSPK